MAAEGDYYIIAIIIVIFIIIAVAIIAYYLNQARGGTVLTTSQISTAFGLAVVTLIVLFIIFFVMLFYAFRGRGEKDTVQTEYSTMPVGGVVQQPVVNSFAAAPGFMPAPTTYPAYIH
jgi:hypothetical protein